uniref:Histone deacetylase interacting domain-containing protein n=1 Tax=Setaria digitata TaxID=48799 RepID=A0A915PT96_9BILA
MSAINGGTNPAVRVPIVNNVILNDTLQSQRENIVPNGNASFQPNQGLETPRECNIRGNVRRLRVEDALCYLDQVKQQFADAPDVYVNFLDVMKDFKSQAIDTPGVIKRVSRLFRGRPNLIIAFNTFLPPGFDVSVDGIKVIITEPNGRKQVINESHAEPSTLESSETTQSSKTSKASSPVQLVTGDQLFIRDQASVSNLVPSAEPVMTEQLESELTAASTDPTASEIRPTNSLSNRVSTATYQDAVMYRNKVMNRFEKRPEIYHKFLEILQRLHRLTQEGGVIQGYKRALEAVELLFENDTDLVQEFKQQFQPNCSGSGLPRPSSSTPGDASNKGRIQKTGDRSAFVVSPQPVCVPKVQNLQGTSPGKRTASMYTTTAAKRAKLGSINMMTYDTNVEEAAKFGTVEDYLFFDKVCWLREVRKALIDNGVHENFLRCLALYNQSIISKNELVELLTPFIGRFTLLLKHVKELLGLPDSHGDNQQSDEKHRRRQLHGNDDMELEHKIDYATCRRLGVSYRSLPESYEKPLCSGRTPLCESVLNDSWVSFPCWSSEDSSAVHSKKTQFEEFVFRTEDERYELDIVIEVNKTALEVLEMVQRKMSRMKSEELNSLRLGPSLGGSSDSVMLRALQRIYGDHTLKMLEGAMKNPQIMIPRLIERMRQKDAEWRKNQEVCNRIWREETEKHYAKSLDHQAVIFKQNDLKLLRAKTIVSQFENLYDERADRNDEGESVEYGPHCIYSYPEDISVLYDVNDLVIHYVKRQANIQKEEKRHAKRYLKRFIPELFNVPPQELSDEEELEDRGRVGQKSEEQRCSGLLADDETQKFTSADEEGPKNTQSPNGNETSTYRLFYGANTWCIFIRLHHLMCDRLAYLKKKHREIIENHEVEERIRMERESVISRCTGDGGSLKSVELDTKLGLSLLKPDSQSPANYYVALISEVKNLLDGLIDSVAFEDNIRKMFGTAAYLTFTMDKIIITIARQLQNMSSEEANIASMDLYKKYRFENPVCLYNRDKNEENIDDAYERAAQEVLVNQNCFKTFFLHDTRSVTMELIDSDVTEEGEKGDSDQEWSRYVHHYVESLNDEPSSSALNPDDQQQMLETIGERPPLFLMKYIKTGMEKCRRRDDEAAKKNEDAIGELKPEEKTSNITVNEDLNVLFSPAGNYKMRFTKDSTDLLIRAGAPRRGMDKHKTITGRRKDRFLAWLEERLCEDGSDVLGPRNWLADGSRIVPVRHPEFPYITYNRYFSSISSTSSTSSSNRSQR